MEKLKYLYSEKALGKVLLLGIGLFAINLLAAIFFERGFFMDGSYFYFRMLETGNFAFDAHPREIAHFIKELPTYLLFKAGVKNPYILSLAYQAVMYLFPLAAVSLCYFITRNDKPWLFTLVLISYLALSVPASFFIHTSTHIAHMAYWVVFVFIVSEKVMTRKDIAFFSVFSAIAILSYESIIFYGPLFLFCIWSFRLNMNGKSKPIWLLAILWFAGWEVFHIHTLFFELTNRPGATSLLDWFNFQTLTSIVTVFVCGAILFWKKASSQEKIIRISFISLAFINLVNLFVSFHVKDPYYDFYARNYMTFLPAIVMSGVVVMHLSKVSINNSIVFHRKFWAAVFSILLLTQSALQLNRTKLWADFRSVIQSDLQTESGLLLFEDSLLAKASAFESSAFKVLAKGWILPCLSANLSSSLTLRTVIIQREDYTGCRLDKHEEAVFDFSELDTDSYRKLQIERGNL